MTTFNTAWPLLEATDLVGDLSDLVVLTDPEAFGDGIEGAVDRLSR